MYIEHWSIPYNLTESSMGTRTLNLGDSVFLYTGIKNYCRTIHSLRRFPSTVFDHRIANIQDKNFQELDHHGHLRGKKRYDECQILVKSLFLKSNNLYLSRFVFWATHLIRRMPGFVIGLHLIMSYYSYRVLWVLSQSVLPCNILRSSQTSFHCDEAIRVAKAGFHHSSSLLSLRIIIDTPPLTQLVIGSEATLVIGSDAIQLWS